MPYTARAAFRQPTRRTCVTLAFSAGPLARAPGCPGRCPRCAPFQSAACLLYNEPAQGLFSLALLEDAGGEARALRRPGKLRIAINAVIVGPHDTGVGIWTRGLIRALARADRENEYVVYHRSAAGVLAPEAGSNFKFVQVKLRGSSRVERIVWEQFVLPGRLEQDGVDVLHCPAYVIPRRARIATLVTIHDLFVFTHPQLCKRLNIVHYRMMVPRAMRRATLIHCTSHWTRTMVCDQFPETSPRVRVIHPCVDGIFKAPDAGDVADFARQYGLDSPPFLFVGNPEPKKNVSLLLSGLAALKERHGLNRKLLLVGGQGWGENIEKRLAALGIQGDVVRTGYLRREKLPLAYGCALALVFPSVVEGFGIPPLEAMACGTPVLTTNNGGLPEAVGCAAMVIKEETPAGLATAMHELEEEADVRSALSEAGLHRVRYFRWDKAAERFVSAYRECAERFREQGGESAVRKYYIGPQDR